MTGVAEMREEDRAAACKRTSTILRLAGYRWMVDELNGVRAYLRDSQYRWEGTIELTWQGWEARGIHRKSMHFQSEDDAKAFVESQILPKITRNW